MAWNYTNDPAGVPLDEVRFLTQDTEQKEQLLSDEEVNHLLAAADNVVRAAASEAARIISRKFARRADTSTPEMKVSFSKRAETYARLASDLIDELPLAGSSSIPEVSFPATVVSEKAALTEDTAITAPIFKHGLHENPGV